MIVVTFGEYASKIILDMNCVCSELIIYNILAKEEKSDYSNNPKYIKSVLDIQNYSIEIFNEHKRKNYNNKIELPIIFILDYDKDINIKAFNYITNMFLENHSAVLSFIIPVFRFNSLNLIYNYKYFRFKRLLKTPRIFINQKQSVNKIKNDINLLIIFLYKQFVKSETLKNEIVLDFKNILNLFKGSYKLSCVISESKSNNKNEIIANIEKAKTFRCEKTFKMTDGYIVLDNISSTKDISDLTEYINSSLALRTENMSLSVINSDILSSKLIIIYK